VDFNREINFYIFVPHFSLCIFSRSSRSGFSPAAGYLLLSVAAGWSEAACLDDSRRSHFVSCSSLASFDFPLWRRFVPRCCFPNFGFVAQASVSCLEVFLGPFYCMCSSNLPDLTRGEAASGFYQQFFLPLIFIADFHSRFCSYWLRSVLVHTPGAELVLLILLVA
jgi:hypothetical protein